MMSDSELERLRTQLYWHEERGEIPQAIKLLRTLQLDALRHALEVVELRRAWMYNASSKPCDNPALPDLQRLIRDLELR